MTWINTPTPLNAEPLGSNSYTMSITGLSASTKYCYRAYFIVDGVEYYGNILTGTTAAISYTAPAVNTGCAYLDYINPSTSIRVSGNCITNNGGAPILEYGVLYTDSAAYATTGNLILPNYPTLISKNALCDNGLMNPFFTDNKLYSLVGLTPNTTYYYRGYAKNAIGTSYGTIKTKITDVAPAPPINIDVNINWNDYSQQGLDDGFGGVYRLYCCNGTLVESCTVSNSKSSTSIWSAPAGCYYVDFTGLEARINYVHVTWDFYWAIAGCCVGWDCCTTCFNSSVTIDAELPMPPM